MRSMGLRKSVLFNLRRFFSFIKILFSNRKAAFGLIIILFFLFMALFPFLFTENTPLGKDPETGGPVGVKFCVPAWFRHLPTWLGGNPHLTENFRAFTDPGFPTIGENGEYRFETDANDLVKPYPDPNFGYPLTVPIKGLNEKNGSLAIKFVRPAGQSRGEVKAYVYRQFYYPYSGYPADFEGNVELFVNGSVHGKYLDVPVRLRFFVGVVEGERYYLWPPVYNNDTKYLGAVDALYGFNFTKGDVFVDRPKSGREMSRYWIISRASPMGASYIKDNQLVRISMGLRGVDSVITKIFSKNPGNYEYGVEITFLDSDFEDKNVWTTVYVDDLCLDLYGNSYGIMGTDHQGYDLFAQLVYGARISLYLGFAVSVMTVLIGLVVGLVAGFLGGIPDQILMRINDLMLCLPTLPLLIVLAAVIGHTIENLMIIMIFLGWNGFARVVRSMTLSLKERPFVEAARAVGAGTGHIIWRHIVPNVMSVVYVNLATSVPGAVTSEAALSWLGFYDPTRMSWGRILNNLSFQGGAAQAVVNPLWPILPGLCIALLASSFILLGYALDEILNPKLRIRR